LIHLTYWSGFQVLNATISDGGFKRTENEKVKSLFKYQEVELKEYFKTTGFNGLDEILFYLEMEIKKSEGETVNFNSFVDSDAWTILKSFFIPDTNTFNAIVFINHSRLTFLRLKSPMQLVEDLDIKPLLGDAKAKTIHKSVGYSSGYSKSTGLSGNGAVNARKRSRSYGEGLVLRKY
jgi:hypothetical protein